MNIDKGGYRMRWSPFFDALGMYLHMLMEELRSHQPTQSTLFSFSF
ncbi:MAG: hypothetical protein AAFQ83_13655 [Bacteroidota bacterium]